MLKVPPGISKRKFESGPLEEAGAVFETLYKKYLSLDADNLQKHAENYLLKSFYNKSSVKNSLNPGGSDFSGPRKSTSNQSSKSECVASSEDNFTKKTSFDLTNRSKDTRYFKKESDNISNEKTQNLNPSNEESDDLNTDLRYFSYELGNSLQNLDQSQSNGLKDTVNSNTEGIKKQGGVEERVRFDDSVDLSKSQKQAKGVVNKLKKGFKKPVIQTEKDDTLVLFDNLSDSSEESVKNKPVERDCLTFEKFSGPSLQGVDEYLSPSNSQRRKVENRESLLSKSRDLAYQCTICILFQSLFTLFLFGLFFGFYSTLYDPRLSFVNILFPFFVHFGAFYLVFTFTDSSIKRRFLEYSNDVTVEVLSKRLNRDLCYRKLNKFSIWGERTLLLGGLLISCIPVNFTNNFTAFGSKEYLYLSLVVVYLVFHLVFTFYYFTFKFKRLLAQSSD